MVIKTFEYNNSAYTLSADCIGDNESGWVVSGQIHEDWYLWVNKFEATHSIYGRVWGDFEDEVFADSEDGLNHFIKNHPPEEWDYADI